MDNEFDIAIVGMACRFPGAGDIAAFWQNLAQGVESIARFSDRELIDAGVPAAWLSRPDYVKAAPVLDDPALFDAAFFGYSPAEAASMDPQHRILLELAHTALEDAGCDATRYRGRIGVFAGSAMNTYFADRGLHARLAEAYIPTLIVNDKDFLATRISYKLGLRGPSLTVQTACSTSLVAVHLARQSLLSKESDMALAATVSVRVPHRAGYFHDGAGVVSADGHVRAFDAAANGTVFGSGAGVVVLKRLEDALADGDHVYAVIKGSAVNNDGAGKAGYTAPSVDGQAEVIVEALANAGLDAADLSYVEAHGSGTPVGDPIEVLALTKAFRTFTGRNGFCALGSAKTNVGHLDAAAGMAGLIKTALALHHRKIPPSLHFNTPNPEIDFPSTPFFVNTRLGEWPATSGKRRAGVMSTGMGGTNAHLILEEAPAPESASPAVGPHLLVVSAKTPSALDALSRNLAEFFTANAGPVEAIDGKPGKPDRDEQGCPPTLGDVAHTLQSGRRALSERRFAVCRDDREAAAAFGMGNTKGVVSGHAASGGRRPVYFLLPGVGDHYVGMGHGLYERYEVFRNEVDRCAGILRAHLDLDIRDVLYPRDRPQKSAAKSRGIDLKKMLDRAEHESGDPAAERLDQTRYCQPSLFTVEYALARQWMDWGLTPERLVGHSMGEYVAACLAGVFSLEDALRLIAVRARLVSGLPRGTMLAIALPENEVRPLLNEHLSISLINGPNLCVVAGPAAPVEDLRQWLTSRGISFRPVRNAHAFHSRMLNPIVDAYEGEVRKIRLSRPQIPYVSNVTGDWITDAQATDPAYWSAHASHTARFDDALQAMWRQSNALLVEIGPGKGLGALALQHPARRQAADPVVVSSLPPHYENVPDAEVILAAVGRLWLGGAAVDWERLRPGSKRRIVSLPTYPFERRRHWFEIPKHDVPTFTLAEALAAHAARLDGDAAATPAAPPESALPSTVALSPPPDPTARVDRQGQIAAKLRALIKELSGIDVASDTVTFMELGFESLFLTQASQLVQAKFGVKISFRQMLGDLSTVEALARYLDGQLPPDAPALAPAAAPVAPPATVDPPSAPMTGTISAGSTSLEQLLTQQVRLMQMILNRPGAPSASPQATAAVPAASPPPSGLRPVRLPSGSATADRAKSLDPGSKRFGPYKPVEMGEKGGLTPRQQDALNRLIERYVRKTAGSKRYTAEHRPHFADPRAVAGFNPNWKEMVYPIVSQRSQGSKIWDIDGNEYIDITMGFGIYLFGHSPDWLMTALEEQMSAGIEIGPQAQLAGKTARLITEFTGLERVTFCNTGSEAVMAAIRLARTVSGRKRIVFFTGDYHGIFDEVLVRGSWGSGQYRSQPAAPGIPENLLENILVLDYGALDSLQIIREHGDEIAAVLVEPVRSRQPGFQPREFLHELRTLTEQIGAALIFDEMVTGFRCHPGGAQAYFGVRADMATFGKVIGAGIPIGILAGRGKYLDALDGGMWNYGDDSFPEVGMTYFAGTFVRHPLALAASWRALQFLKEEGPGLQLRMAERVSRFCRTLNEFFEQRQVPISLPCFASFATVEHAPDLKHVGLLWYYLREKGVLAWEGRTLYFTIAHSDGDLDRMITAFKESVREMQEGGFLPETPASAKPFAEAAAAGPPFPRYDSAPLTEAQHEMILAAIMDDDANCVYNQSITVDLRGPLNVPALLKSIEHLFERHPALRSTFSLDLESQHFHPTWAGRIFEVDLSAMTEAEQAGQIEEQVSLEMTTPFDLTRGPLVRVSLLRLSADNHRLIFTAHHLVCDGWSTSMLVFDLSRVYNALVANRIPLLPPPRSFAEFARQRAARRSSPADQAAEKYWLEQYAEPPPVLNLPTDRPRPPTRTFAGAMERRLIDSALFARLKSATPHLGGTVFATLFGVCATLLQRLTSQNDLVIGVPAAGQAAIGNPDLVGHCMNFLPIRIRVTPELPFQKFAQCVKVTLLNAHDHQSYTYGTLLQNIKAPRDPGRPPLLSVIFNIDKSGFDVFGFDGLTYSVSANAKKHVNFDLFFNLVQTETSLELGCEYNTDLFDHDTIVRWLGHFERLIEAIVADATGPVDSLPLLSSREKSRLLVDWNNTTVPLPIDGTIHSLVEEQAARTPNAIAILGAGDRFTYGQLEQKANRLAHRLRTLGVGPNELVAVSLGRSPDLVVALLGILKAGGAYVPIDPDYPADRRALMLADAGVRLLLTQKSLLDDARAGVTPVLCLDRDIDGIERESSQAPDLRVAPSDLAYTIYTSGSTGRPKGVQIEHRAVVNLIRAMQKTPGLTSRDVLLAVTTLSFDIAGLELFVPLAAGGSIVLASREDAADGEALLRLIDRHHVTVLQATPATWRLMLASGWNGTPRLKALCGGEALGADLAAELLPRCGELWNMYGPTETTIWSTCARVTDARTIPIGRPIDNTAVYVLDSHRRLLPTGVTGELFIGGAGLARGYLRRPELTAEKFVSHPFKAGERLYRTGDLARYRNDGNLELLGRLDFQVKIRGYRIELGEIETVLASHPAVKQAVVAAREDSPGDKRLIAYVVPSSTSRPTVAAGLRDYLRGKLPDFMIPAAFIQLDALPLTPNGKIDRKALPAPATAGTEIRSTMVAPRNPTEKRLQTIFENVLKVPVPSVDDNFFDRGGHSLLAVRLMMAIEKEFRVRLPLATLLRDPTVAGIAHVLTEPSAASVQESWAPLVSIQSNGSRPPLFLVHGAGGNILLYRELGRRLGAAQPLYGLQAIGLDGRTAPLGTVEEMAQAYLPHLRRVQPAGPYHLGGYCMGGMVAYQMARLLADQGEKVALLALLDTYNLSTVANASVGSGNRLFQRLKFHLGNLARLRPGEVVVYLREKTRIARDGELANILNDIFGASNEPRARTGSTAAMESVQEANDRAATLFQPRPYAGRVTVFRPRVNYDSLSDPRMGWGELALGGIEVVELPVNPHAMLMEPFVRQLAAEINQRIVDGQDDSRPTEMTRRALVS